MASSHLTGRSFKQPIFSSSRRYFETTRTLLIAGRTFTDGDNTTDRRLIMIDDALAKKAFPGESAVGERSLIRLKTPEPRRCAHTHCD